LDEIGGLSDAWMGRGGNMKKTLFIIFMVSILSGCESLSKLTGSYVPVDKETDFSIEGTVRFEGQTYSHATNGAPRDVSITVISCGVDVPVQSQSSAQDGITDFYVVVESGSNYIKLTWKNVPQFGLNYRVRYSV